MVGGEAMSHLRIAILACSPPRPRAVARLLGTGERDGSIQAGTVPPLDITGAAGVFSPVLKAVQGQ